MYEALPNEQEIELKAQGLRNKHTELAKKTKTATRELEYPLYVDTGNIKKAVDAAAAEISYNTDTNASTNESYGERIDRTRKERAELSEEAQALLEEASREPSREVTGMTPLDFKHSLITLGSLQAQTEYNDHAAEEHYRENMGTYQELGHRAAQAAHVEINVTQQDSPAEPIEVHRT